MKIFWIRNVTLATWLAIAASHRIITVERQDDPFSWCIVEGAFNETISWEFENQHLLDNKESTETRGFSIWPKPQFFNLSSGDWDVKYNGNKAFVHTHFGPVTDFQWNDFQIVDLKNMSKRTKIKEPGDATHLQFSLLTNSSVDLRIMMKRSQHDYELRIDDSTSSNPDSSVVEYRTFLRKQHVSTGAVTLDSSLNSNISHEPHLANGVRWITYDFFANLKRMRLTSEGRTLIDQPVVNEEHEMMNLLEISSNGIAKLKVHSYQLAVVTCEERKIIKGEWNLDGEKRACIEVTYFSPNSSLNLTIANKDFSDEITFPVADNWKIERFMSEQVLPGGNYKFEITRNSVSVIRRIRFCSETEYFVYKINKKHLAGKNNTSKCYSLASKISQALSQKPDTELRPEHETSDNLISFLESEFKKPDQKGGSKSATVCISAFGCFCWAGWTGPNCTKACQLNEYGMNCGSVCGECKEIQCDRLNGHCLGGCKNLFIPPLCIEPIVLSTQFATVSQSPFTPSIKMGTQMKTSATSVPVYGILLPTLLVISLVVFYAYKKLKSYYRQDDQLTSQLDL